MELRELLQNITPPDEAAREQAHRRWAACAKPLGSLGLLETALEDIAALTGDAQAPLLPRAVLVLCADNGVVAQGVTQTDSSVTAAVTRNLAAGRTSVCRMAQAAQCAVVPVDMGVRDFAPQPGVLARRIGNGTGDITQGPAMTRAQAEQAVLAGAELVRTQKEKGVRLLATGEMGIGNTTTASAVASVLLGRAPVEMTGRGAGLSDEGLRRKVAAIERAVALSRPAADDPLDVLAKVGGFDIAGMCGVFLGGAACRVPVLADGFISAVAALCAVRLCPAAAKAVLASHVSAEPAGMLLLDALRKKPLITAGMRLGEGTGAVAAIERAVALSRPAADDPLDVLAKVGGFDIAGMCGVFLGGAACRVPVLADGFISAVAALCAVRLCPAAAKAVLASHVSAEPAGMLLLDALRKKPLITAGMRLGEGTGAVAAMPLLDMARAVYMDCYTFEEGGIEAYTPQGGEG